jgi:hypothetical protein
VAGVAPTSDHVAVFRQNESAPLVKSFIALLRAKTRDLQSAA